jgi:hypothetical protein
MQISQTFQHALYWAKKLNEPLQICENHYHALNKLHYTFVNPDTSTVCIWRIKLKDGIMFDNTSNPES